MLEKAYGASWIGKVHVKLNKPNQDAFILKNNEDFTIAIVCDGLGSKKYSHIGSRRLCKILAKELKKSYENKSMDLELIINKTKIKWKRSIWPIKPNKADTTCLFVLCTNKNILCCQLGDGIIVIDDSKQIQIVNPKDDDFANETVSFYKSNIKQWKYKFIKKEQDCKYNILMSTDGISDDLIIDNISEFINEISKNLNNNEYTNNKFLKDMLMNWPNKYSNDDKTVVVIKND